MDEDLIEFGKKVFRHKHFFELLYFFYTLFNTITMGILMAFSNNALSIMLLVFSLLFGMIIPLQYLIIKFHKPWNKNRIRKDRSTFFNSFKDSLNKLEITTSMSNNYYSWKRKTNIIKVFRPTQIVACIFLLLIYIPYLIIFDLKIYEMNLNQNFILIEKNIISQLLSPIFLILYISIFLIIFFFFLLESYTTRFRRSIEAIILEAYRDIINNQIKLIDKNDEMINFNEKLNVIRNQLDSIFNFISFEVLGLLRRPEYEYNLKKLFKKYSLVKIVEFYEIYMKSIDKDLLNSNQIRELNQLLDYLEKIKYRTIKDNQNVKLILLEGKTERNPTELINEKKKLFNNTIKDFLEAIDEIEENSLMKTIIREEKYNEEIFRDYFSSYIKSKEKYILAKEFKGKIDRKSDLKIASIKDPLFRISIEFKIWKRNFNVNEPISELLENMGNYDEKGILLMINPLKKQINEKLKNVLIFNHNKYIENSFQEIKCRNRLFSIFKATYLYKNQSIEVYHIIIDLFNYIKE